MTIKLSGAARPAPAVAEEVTKLPPPSEEWLNRIVKRRNPDSRVSKAYLCVESSGRGYQWAQIATSE